MTNEKQEHSESKSSEGFLRILKEVKAIDAKGIHPFCWILLLNSHVDFLIKMTTLG
jgi:hypothetical protein